MSTLAKLSDRVPSVFDDLFQPWTEWFDPGAFFGRSINVPAANITEHKNEYHVSLAVPGMKKDDFKIEVNANILTISSESEESKEEKEKAFARKEYSYSSFRRSFTLPDEILKDKIEAKYENGILKVVLPRKEKVEKISKQIPVK